MSEHSEFSLESRIEKLERWTESFERPCEEGLSKEHLVFHWRYSEAVAAQLGEIKTKLFLMEGKFDRILAMDVKLDRILALFHNLKEA